VDRPTQWRQALCDDVTVSRAQVLADLRAAEDAARLQQETLRRVRLDAHASVCRFYDISANRPLMVNLFPPHYGARTGPGERPPPLWKSR
jgi:hypothetical protein